MAYCPNCQTELDAASISCAKCGADFGAEDGWKPTDRPCGSGMPSTGPYMPGKIGWANISLALAFSLSALFSPGLKLLNFAVSAPVMRSIPPYQGHLLVILASYLTPAVLIYMVLRVTRMERWIKPTRSIHTLIGLGNTLLVLYITPRVLASTVQGGGASFVVMMFAPYFIFPAVLFFLIGFVWLILRSVKQRKSRGNRLPFGRAECFAVLIAIAIPFGLASPLFVGDNAPFRMASEADKIFQTKCAAAGENMLRQPPAEVKGLYLERDGEEYFERIENGVYAAYGSSILGEPLVNSGLLLFMEKPNDRPRPEDVGQSKYRRYILKDWKGVPIDEIESTLGVFRKELTTDTEKKLGIRGAEVSIRDLGTNDVIATTTYFVSSRHQKICGNAPNGRFSVSTFLIRTLNLTRQYPSAWPNAATVK